MELKKGHGCRLLDLNRLFLKMNHLKFDAPEPHAQDMSLTQFRYLQNKTKVTFFHNTNALADQFFGLKSLVLRVSARHRVYSLKILVFFIGY